MEQTYLNSINLNANSNFPYLVLDVTKDDSVPRNPGYRVMHWHEDLQFILVPEGAIHVQTLRQTVSLRQGEGLFINRGVVHLVMPDGICHYNSFLFPDELLRFAPCAAAGCVVTAITQDADLELYHLKTSSDWEKEALRHLQTLAALQEKRDSWYEYTVLTELCALWLVLAKNLPHGSAKADTIMRERMRLFLDYTAAHLAEPLTIAGIAEAANVSVSECLRCFRQSLGTTPYRYLMDVRLAKAASLLTDTDMPVQQIAENVGFSTVSHFGKCFRERVGCSPRAYRLHKNK